MTGSTRGEKVQRMAQVIRLRPEAVAEYRRLHENVWPQVRVALSEANLTNYSIFLREPENLMFSYWEYVGVDFEEDMRRMLSLPDIQRWWDLCAPLQEPLDSKERDEWWAGMVEIFHLG
jgi:L-rhamnose mutarotase